MESDFPIFWEYKYTREIAAAVVQHLQYRGFDAALVTPEEYDVSLRARTEQRNRGNYWVVYCGGSIMTAVPNLSGVEAPAEATIALTASAMTFTLADIPSDVTNLKLVIQASEPPGQRYHPRPQQGLRYQAR